MPMWKEAFLLATLLASISASSCGASVRTFSGLHIGQQDVSTVLEDTLSTPASETFTLSHSLQAESRLTFGALHLRNLHSPSGNAKPALVRSLRRPGGDSSVEFGAFEWPGAIVRRLTVEQGGTYTFLDDDNETPFDLHRSFVTCSIADSGSSYDRSSFVRCTFANRTSVQLIHHRTTRPVSISIQVVQLPLGNMVRADTGTLDGSSFVTPRPPSEPTGVFYSYSPDDRASLLGELPPSETFVGVSSLGNGIFAFSRTEGAAFSIVISYFLITPDPAGPVQMAMRNVEFPATQFEVEFLPSTGDLHTYMRAAAPFSGRISSGGSPSSLMCSVRNNAVQRGKAGVSSVCSFLEVMVNVTNNTFVATTQSNLSEGAIGTRARFNSSDSLIVGLMGSAEAEEPFSASIDLSVNEQQDVAIARARLLPGCESIINATVHAVHIPGSFVQHFFAERAEELHNVIPLPSPVDPSRTFAVMTGFGFRGPSLGSTELARLSLTGTHVMLDLGQPPGVGASYYAFDVVQLPQGARVISGNASIMDGTNISSSAGGVTPSMLLLATHSYLSKLGSSGLADTMIHGRLEEDRVIFERLGTRGDVTVSYFAVDFGRGIRVESFSTTFEKLADSVKVSATLMVDEHSAFTWTDPYGGSMMTGLAQIPGVAMAHLVPLSSETVMASRHPFPDLKSADSTVTWSHLRAFPCEPITLNETVISDEIIVGSIVVITSSVNATVQVDGNATFVTSLNATSGTTFVVSGEAFLGGTLNLVLSEPPTAGHNVTITLVQAASLSGSFDQINVAGALQGCDSLAYTPVQEGGTFSVIVSLVSCAEEPFPIGAVVGAALGAVLVAVLVGVAVHCYMKRQKELFTESANAEIRERDLNELQRVN